MLWNYKKLTNYEWILITTTEIARIAVVSANKRNIHVLKDLLNELKIMMEKYSCWGRPIGSSQLWQQHYDTIERISRMIDNIELAPSQPDCQSTSFNELPVEMVREIILRLDDYRDLINSARASPVMKQMILSQNVWQRLCKYHFTEQQLKTVLDGYKRTPQHRRPISKYVRTDSSELRKPIRKDAPRARSTIVTSANKNTNEIAKSTPPSRSAMPTGGQIRSQPCSGSSSGEEESQSTAGIGNCDSHEQNRAVKLNRLEAASSYVNRTRKFFDSKSTEVNNVRAATSRITSFAGKKVQRSCDSTKRFKHTNNDTKEELLVDTSATKPPSPSTSRTISGKLINERLYKQKAGPVNDRIQELDWEDVFHQLRK